MDSPCSPDVTPLDSWWECSLSESQISGPINDTARQNELPSFPVPGWSGCAQHDLTGDSTFCTEHTRVYRRGSRETSWEMSRLHMDAADVLGSEGNTFVALTVLH